MNKQIAKLEAEADYLLDLTIRAYQRFSFLRPMLGDEKLHERINKEGKARGFNRLRLWLYWSLVQQLSNICSDKDKRSPSIATMTEKLKDDQLQPDLPAMKGPGVAPLRTQLEEKCLTNRLLEEAEVRADFNQTYDDYLRRADEMLSSRAVGGYKKVRNKLISHNDPRFDVKDAKLKFGDERILLETLQVLTKQLLLIVRNTDFSWQSVLQREADIAQEFWGT
jgi:hypothetical protein